MPETIEVVNKLIETRGEAFAEGFMAAINLTLPAKPDPEEPEEKPGK